MFDFQILTVRPLLAITSQGSAITISSGSSALAAIDTGTTLIGGPADAVAEIYSNIPNAEAGTGQLEGYYIYREYCFLSFDVCPCKQ